MGSNERGHKGLLLAVVTQNTSCFGMVASSVQKLGNASQFREYKQFQVWPL